MASLGARLVAPVEIRYGDALLVAAFGLGVNLLSAWLLGQGMTTAMVETGR